jgi:3,4-dihydroxy 2-butanone 4-phosphate synthase/GTP cyclohydrolase II
MGDIANRENVLCRVHSACLGGHVFNSIECECAGEMAAAQNAIQSEGRGLIIYLDQEGKGNGHLALIKSIPYKQQFGQAEAYVRAGYRADARDYRVAAQILNELAVGSIVLLASSETKAADLRKEGIEIGELRPLELKHV